MFPQATKFEILSDISQEGEVFDRLIEVRHTLSGEVGLLLCSHYSRWPAELIPQATWLAGCFTPVKWGKDSRLVFGNIPDYTINWLINRQERFIVLQVGRSALEEFPGYDEEGAEIPYVRAQVWTSSLGAAFVQRIKAVERMLLPGARDISNYNRFLAVVTFIENSSRFVSGEWAYVAQTLDLWSSQRQMSQDLLEEIGQFEWDSSLEKEGVNITSSIDGDHLVLLGGQTSNLPLMKIHRTGGGWKVSSNLCKAAEAGGYAEAVDSSFFVDYYGEKIVIFNSEISGLAIASSLLTKEEDRHPSFLAGQSQRIYQDN